VGADTKEELKSIVKEAIQEHFLDDAHTICPVARKCNLTESDFFLVKRFIGAWNKTVAIVGTAVVLAVLGGFGYIVKIGLETWRKGGAGG